MKNARNFYSLIFVHVAVAVFSLGSITHPAGLQNEVDPKGPVSLFLSSISWVSEVHGRFKQLANRSGLIEIRLSSRFHTKQISSWKKNRVAS